LLGEPIAPDPAENSRAAQKAAMASGPTNGLKSTALGLYERMTVMRSQALPD
jgi:hypothetical protein